MIILGLYYGHNASACVIKDGKVLINWELERFTRVKHDYGYNQKFVDKTLEHCGITYDDVDYIATNFPISILSWIEKNEPKKMTPYKSISTNGSEYLRSDVKGKRLIAVNHHLCHAAGAYYTSPFSRSKILFYILLVH